MGPSDGRTRRASGWAAFLAAVITLRLAGIGSEPPPEVGAASAADAGTEQGEAAGRLVAIVDDTELADFVASARRCLEAGPTCAPDDLLDADTAHLRLASLSDLLGRATDRTSPSYVGPLDAPTADAFAGAQGRALAASDALGAFVVSGCAGSIEGAPLDAPPPGCPELVAAAQDALRAFDAAVASTVDVDAAAGAR